MYAHCTKALDRIDTKPEPIIEPVEISDRERHSAAAENTAFLYKLIIQRLEAFVVCKLAILTNFFKKRVCPLKYQNSLTFCI